MKYIDVDKIRADIERLKKENDHIRCENKAYCRGYGDAFIDLLSSLGILEEPVSENLEEAVSEQICIAADKHIKRVIDLAGHPGWEWTRQDIADAFKAGAEWMAEQGVSMEYEVEDKCLELGYGSIPGLDPIITLPDSFQIGDKVILQVREK